MNPRKQFQLNLTESEAEILYDMMNDPFIPETSHAGLTAFVIRKQLAAQMLLNEPEKVLDAE